jgi:hypothetical protein
MQHTTTPETDRAGALPVSPGREPEFPDKNPREKLNNPAVFDDFKGASGVF